MSTRYLSFKFGDKSFLSVKSFSPDIRQDGPNTVQLCFNRKYHFKRNALLGVFYQENESLNLSISAQHCVRTHAGWYRHIPVHAQQMDTSGKHSELPRGKLAGEREPCTLPPGRAASPAGRLGLAPTLPDHGRISGKFGESATFWGVSHQKLGHSAVTIGLILGANDPLVCS